MATSKQVVRVVAAPGTCGCGCGAALRPAPRFVQGHDAKLHSALAAALREGATHFQDGDQEPITIQERYAQSGWTLPKPKAPKAEATEAK